MDQWKGEDFGGVLAPSSTQLVNSDSRKRSDVESGKDPLSARKVHKADREKSRRDRLNEHFMELGNTLDPDRPKNDKATILTDTIQVLKDLTSDVNKLKSECAALNDESRELTLEKNELREEKASLKSEIENLNAQYQQRVRVMFPWGAMDPSVVMAPPYSYPMPVAVPPGPIPMHPSLQPFPYYQAQNSATVPNPCPTFISYPTPIPAVEQLLAQPQYASVSRVSSKQDSKSKSSDQQRGGNAERCDDSNEVATELVLKMPGSSAPQESSCGVRKGKQSQNKDRNITDGSSSSRYSSSQVVQESSSNSVTDIPKTNK